MSRVPELRVTEPRRCDATRQETGSNAQRELVERWAREESWGNAERFVTCRVRLVGTHTPMSLRKGCARAMRSGAARAFCDCRLVAS